MSGCMFAVQACLTIWMLPSWCLASNNELHLSPFPGRPSPGHNFTFICNASFIIGRDSITWKYYGIPVLTTHNNDRTIITHGILTSNLYVSTHPYQHNLTIIINTGHNWGPWQCRSNVKGVNSNSVFIKLEPISSSRVPSFTNTVSSSSSPTFEQRPHQSMSSLVTKRTTEEQRLHQSTGISVTKRTTEGKATGQGANATSDHSVDVGTETIYIAVGASVGAVVLITGIAVIVCCLLKRKPRGEENDEVFEDNVLYESSTCGDTNGYTSTGKGRNTDGPLYASINKTKTTSIEGVNLDELYAKPNKTKQQVT